MMRLFLVTCLAVACAANVLDRPLMNAEEVELINTYQHQWKAGFNENFNGWSVRAARKLMGALPDQHKLPVLQYPSEVTSSLPESFDSRKLWPACIGPVRNQAKCGSCWAFGAAEAISDRMCITSSSSSDTNSSYMALAPLDLVSCDQGMFGNNGCEGGQLSLAWQYAKDYGLVSEECSPYGTWESPNPGPIPTCAPQDQPCLNFVPTPACNKTCANGRAYGEDKHKISSVYAVGGADNIAAEIMKNGPVEAAFTVYSDFVHYKSGVYSHTTGQMLGGHAIKIIGWGVENGVKYWTVQNSWTTAWGADGYFKIQRGNDECGIEDNVVAGSV